MNYLTSIRKEFVRYKALGEKAMAQVPEEGLHWQFNEASNSMATIVKHLWGNMLSRWTDFLTTDGEKEWRNREAEFASDNAGKEEILARWEEGWACLLGAIDQLAEEDLNTIVYIRAEPHSVVEALNRQLAHYASHVGQLVYLARMVAGDEWKSLSIPRGQSAEFNKKMFGKG